MIRLSKACVDHEEVASISKVFEEPVHFGLGSQVGLFEAALGEFIGGQREVVCVNTGTSALHLALEALGFPEGSEVLVPSITFVASYAAISAARLKPVSVDVTFPDCHIDPNDAARRITSKTVAIMPVAYAGCDFDRSSIYSLAQKHQLRVIEDDAHAFGSLNLEGKNFGSTGDIICFSFDGIKNITCGEGGAIVTGDKDLARTMRIQRSMGVEKDVELRYEGKRAWEYDVKTQGFRYHMSNLNAAVGLSQLKKFPKFHQKKQQILQTYMKSLMSSELADFLLPTQKLTPSDCFHIFSCILPKGTERQPVREFLAQNSIESGFHYVPNHTHTFYRSSYELPVAEELGRRLLSLPFHADINEEQIEKIVSTVTKAIRKAIH